MKKRAEKKSKTLISDTQMTSFEIIEMAVYNEKRQLMAGIMQQNGIQPPISKNTENEVPSAETVVEPQRLFWATYGKIAMGMAASLTILAVALITFSISKPNTPDALAQAFLSSEEMASTTIRKGNTTATNWEEAFNQEKFEAVVVALNSLPNRTNREIYYLAYAHLKQGQYTQAATHFEQFLTAPDAELEVIAHWYLALSLVKDKRGSAAIPHLEAVEKDQRNTKTIERSEKAKQLRERLLNQKGD